KEFVKTEERVSGKGSPSLAQPAISGKEGITVGFLVSDRRRRRFRRSCRREEDGGFSARFADKFLANPRGNRRRRVRGSHSEVFSQVSSGEDNDLELNFDFYP
ncbi:hypothetical protein U1Q18_047739, partial [Sarracenia purpurea var. burkii]